MSLNDHDPFAAPGGPFEPPMRRRNLENHESRAWTLVTPWNPTKPPKESLEKLGQKWPKFGKAWQKSLEAAVGRRPSLGRPLATPRQTRRLSRAPRPAHRRADRAPSRARSRWRP